jgi:hypothetical protein
MELKIDAAALLVEKNRPRNITSHAAPFTGCSVRDF